jgi:hypothetical protein
VLAPACFRPPRCDCSIKEQGGACDVQRELEGFVLNNFFTAAAGE